MTPAIFIFSGLPAQNLKNLEDNNGFKKIQTRLPVCFRHWYNSDKYGCNG
jgi:hypothetical protein